jgi:hypothetical protein
LTEAANTAVEVVGTLLLWLMAVPVVLVLAWVAGHVAFKWFALCRFRLEHVRSGRDLLIVYSHSPNWQTYIEREWLPRWGHRAVILNWSERKQWRFSTPAVLLFRAYTGDRAFNPIAMVVPRWWGRPTVIPFWQAFLDLKHGKSHTLQKAERQLEDALQRQASRKVPAA